ncbi:unnamed protein product [Somion occarium]|uniref:Uncharacterized protein n=1 Tax=Somion occarium TaxID=3059160 RepID=A0ABP1CQ40_9APHY
MGLPSAQRSDIEAILSLLFNTTNQRKRRLADVFLELVDKEEYPEYYQVIPEPRCLNSVKRNLGQDTYNDALDVYNDLNLVFLNAMYYNEEGSMINRDAKTLKGLLDREWRQRPRLPTPRSSPPPSSAQKTHNVATPSQPLPPISPSTPLLPLSSPADRAEDVEMEVDIGGTPEPESIPVETVRDAESDDIVSQLEKSLPRWEGFGDVGWADHLTTETQVHIVKAIVEYRDASGVRLAASLEALPEETNKPEIPFTKPLSLSLIDNKARNGEYTSQTFDREMSELFLKGRRSYEPCSEPYGHVLTLQRFYQSLSSGTPSNPPPPLGPPYAPSLTHFSALPAGPGRVKPLNSPEAEGVAGVTMFRISNKDRRFVDEVNYKGWSIRLAEWLHLMNPDDARRPVIGQVFKCWVSEEPAKKGQFGITVCWYYRPEQTFHPEDRQFWENEIFKTGHFVDHPLPDIIEKIACQFTARHIRGRPRPPFWYPYWPLYVCDSRYNDRERLFVKIKNWNSCVPEEVRKSEEFMPIYPFERIVFPRRFPSPFVGVGPGKEALLNELREGKIPGGIIAGSVVEKGEGERVEGGGTGRKRPKRHAGTPSAIPQTVISTSSRHTDATDRFGPSKGLYVGQPSQTAQLTLTPATTQQTTSQSAYQYTTQMQTATDRSLMTGAGLVGSNVVTEKLPPETTRHFDRDPQTNEVLWFAAPPIDIALPPVPKYSLAYLHHLARKRKREAAGMEQNGEEEHVEDRTVGKSIVETQTERLGKVLSEMGMPEVESQS